MSVIRILFLGANPAATTRLALEREVREIRQRLEASPQRDRFVLLQEWAVRVDALHEVLLRHRPDIIHFSGHGLRGPDGEVVDGARDVVAPGSLPAGGAIVLEGENGVAAPVMGTAFGKLLGILGGVRCVVLNACFSSAQSDALRQHVACVIGMADAIHDRSAIAFSWAFYQGLAFGRTVETAVELGRNQIDVENLPGADLPRIATRDGVSANTITFAADVEPPGPGSRRWIVAGLGVVVVALGGWGAYRLMDDSTKEARVAIDGPARPIDAGIDGSGPPREAPDGMVWIPPADVTLGTAPEAIRALRERCPSLKDDAWCKRLEDSGYWSREPQRGAHVDGFFLDRTEVTVGAFAGWLATRSGVEVTNGVVMLDGTPIMRDPGVIEVTSRAGAPGLLVAARDGYEQLPMFGVSWEGALRFCRSRGATLPTGEQWERAARGTSTTYFAWGDDPPACAELVVGRGAPGCGPADLAPVGSTSADRTSEGVFDLVGNVAEWTLDGDERGHHVRGGTLTSSWITARPAGHVITSELEPDVGFRCAASSDGTSR